VLFGGNLSLRFPQGKRPLIIVDQYKMITYQSLFPAKSWKGPHGEALILPKGEGEGIMVSAFVLSELGLGSKLTNVQLATINCLRLGKEYASKEEVIGLFWYGSEATNHTRTLRQQPLPLTFFENVPIWPSA
jgi:hypothetical protein